MFRLFLTHLASEREFVASVQRVLASQGIDSFVAHNDIKPSAEWVTSIELALWTCDALAAFLHNGFQQSLWCDQEVGFVFGRRKPMVPLAIDTLPYGLLGKYQAILCKGEPPPHVARSIVDTLLENRESRQGIIDAQLYALADALSFDHANGIAGRLSGEMQRDDWTGERLDLLTKALENRQVSDARRAEPWARETLKEHRPPLVPPPSDKDVPF